MNLREKDYDYFWGRTVPDTKYEVDSNGNIIFEGQYPPGESTANTVWIIARYFYDGNNNIIAVKIRTKISWDDRNSIS